VLHLGGHGVDGELEPVPVGVEEVDRLADAVVDRPQHVDAVRLDARLGAQQGLLVRHAQREVLNPQRRVRVAPHVGRLGQLEERDVAAVVHAEEDVHVGMRLAGARHAVLGHGHGVLEPEHAGVEVGGLFRVPAAVRDVVQLLDVHADLREPVARMICKIALHVCPSAIGQRP
jgi:hypothetical protein